MGEQYSLHADHLKRNAGVKSDRYEQKRLSRREQQVMQLLANGKTTREIANQLGLSLKTIQVYVARIKEKFRLENMSQVIRLAAISFRPGMATDLSELLDCAEKIEVRFFDQRGRLIATRHFSADSRSGQRVRKRWDLLNRRCHLNPQTTSIGKSL